MVNDLLGQFRSLVARNPEQATLFSYGRSRAGEELLALRLGRGPMRVLAYAFPQPDEPLGGPVLLRLAEAILGDEKLRDQVTWTLLPCVDPDGARRNEGWFAAPSLAGYARHHFRPPEGEQVEWSFPSDDPDWPWHSSLPETRALQTLLEDLCPDLLFPLHNSLLGGAYAFLSPNASPLAARLPSRWETRRLPTHRGEPELPFVAELVPGVYCLPTPGDIAAALRGQGIADPAAVLPCGAPAYLYAQRFAPTQTVVVELPFFAVPGIDDIRLSTVGRRDLVRQDLSGDEQALAEWNRLYALARPILGPANPYRSFLEMHRAGAGELIAATARALADCPGSDWPATQAEVIDSRQIAPYLRLLPLGVLRQALLAEARPSAHALAARVGEELETALDSVLSSLAASVVPLTTLIEVQVETIVGAVVERCMKTSRQSPVPSRQ